MNQKEFITLERKEYEALLERIEQLESELMIMRDGQGHQEWNGINHKKRRAFWQCFNRVAMVLLALLLLLSASFGPNNQDFVEVKNGFYTGNTYLRMQNKLTYITGLVDGFCGAQLLCDIKTYRKFGIYMTGKENYQIQAIVDKYLKEHPQKWDYNMAVLVYSAIFDLK